MLAPEDAFAAIGGSSGGIRRVRVPTAPEAAASALRDAILAGNLKPGERVIEQKLAASLGIGQPTVREALKELEFQGFVRKIPRRGTYVTKLSQDDFRKILEVRMVLELLAIGLAAGKMTPEVDNELTGLTEQMGRAAEKFDLGAFHKADMAFHRIVWGLSGNEYLDQVLESVAFRLFAFVLLQRDPGSRNEFLASAKQHDGILAGLRTRDPQEARRAFVSETAKFWRDFHEVSLNEDVLRADSSSFR